MIEATTTVAREAYRRPAAEVVAALGSDPVRGLSAAEARRRLERYGPNELRGKPPVPAWRRLLAQVQSPLVLLLLLATLISLAAWWAEGAEGPPFEALAILAIVALNALLGYYQEARAEAAVAALQRMAQPSATVIRDGERQQIPSREVVPGDLLLVEEGDVIAADARLIEVSLLQTVEAALTGESQPVAKDVAPLAEELPITDQSNMIFSGTMVSFGRGKAVVVATGRQTEVGRIAGLIEAAPEEETPLQREIDHVGRLLGLAVIAIAVVVVATILLITAERTLSTVAEVLLLGVSLAVAAVPEGLPTILTVVLALGVQRMARRNAIVKRLAAVETLGSATVICSDKTGTLTRNEMTVRTVVTPSEQVDLTGVGYEPVGEVTQQGQPLRDPRLLEEVRRVLRAATLASNARLYEEEGVWKIQGDPTEAALLVAARKAGVHPAEVAERYRRLGEVPFSSERKLMSTVQTDARHEELDVFAKGAPDVLLARCTHERVGDELRPLTAERRAAILASVDQLAGQALRTLGVAYRPLARQAYPGEPSEELEQDLIFLGVVGIMDPPRPEAQEAVAKARSAGIRVIMITGDHPRTAAAIAAELGIIPPGGRAVVGAELERMDDEALLETVREVAVYARVSPEHKLRIVRALKRDGHIVAMTGDGVNDAPALKTADIGVAMGIAGTDVSKEAADMILTDDNFATIVAAIEEGRAIFANIRKFLRYLLSSNIGEVATMFFGVLLAGSIGLGAGGETLVLPLLATQILWINLLTDSGPALAVGVDPRDPEVMRQPPRRREERVIDREMWLSILLVGAVMAFVTLLTLDLGLAGGVVASDGSLIYARTLAFTVLVFCQLFNVFNARSGRASAFRGLFTNPLLWGAVALSAAFQVLVVYVPVLQQAFSTTALSPLDWLLCIAMASLVLWAEEVKKLLLRLAGPPRPVPGPAVEPDRPADSLS